MDVRDKLVEQLRWWSNECDRTNFGCQASELLVAAANYIANGVTVQEWIPVEDRLPEPFVSVLACIPSEEPLPTVHESYIADHGAWVCILTAERYKTGEVTHWMPLPEPPKVE